MEFTVVFSSNPEFTSIQFAPLFVERKTPLCEVPANNVLPIAAKQVTVTVSKPLSAYDQLIPLSVERKTLNSVAMKSFVPMTATQRIVDPVNSPLSASQFVPLSVET